MEKEYPFKQYEVSREVKEEIDQLIQSNRSCGETPDYVLYGPLVSLPYFVRVEKDQERQIPVSGFPVEIRGKLVLLVASKNPKG